MSTVVAVESPDRVVMAADSAVVEDGTVRSRSADRVRRLDGVLAGAVGDVGAVDEFHRRVGAAVDRYETERGDRIEVDPVASIAAEEASAAGVDAVVAAPDADGRPRLRRIDPDGETESVDRTAVGSGAAVALGGLESFDPEAADADPEAELRGLLDRVDSVDPETDGETNVVALTAADTGAETE